MGSKRQIDVTRPNGDGVAVHLMIQQPASAKQRKGVTLRDRYGSTQQQQQQQLQRQQHN
jgi:hypothetical protein